MARPAFRGGAAHVRVPATSANLGPGYDVFGLALSLYDDVIARVADSGLSIDVAGEGAGQLPNDESHLVVRSMRVAFERLGGQPPGLELVCANRIPHGRGLGSSSAAIVAGLVLARALVLGGNERLPDEELLQLASDIEGHPDNVAPCLLGGLVLAYGTPAAQPNPSSGKALPTVALSAVQLPVRLPMLPVVFIPPFESSTAGVRKLIPDLVPLPDAVYNAGRAALLVAAFAGQGEHLLEATGDRLHQPYRASAYPQTAELVTQLRVAGLAAVVSGAGPTVLVLALDEASATLAASMAPAQWRCERLEVSVAGATLAAS